MDCLRLVTCRSSQNMGRPASRNASRIRPYRASPSHLASMARNHPCGSFSRAADLQFRLPLSKLAVQEPYTRSLACQNWRNRLATLKRKPSERGGAVKCEPFCRSWCCSLASAGLRQRTRPAPINRRAACAQTSPNWTTTIMRSCVSRKSKCAPI